MHLSIDLIIILAQFCELAIRQSNFLFVSGWPKQTLASMHIIHLNIKSDYINTKIKCEISLN